MRVERWGKVSKNIFGTIEDPRVQGRCDDTLVESITIAICAIISGSETWTDIETYGESKQKWLSQFLPLENGIPSHDTLGSDTWKSNAIA